MDYHRKNRRRKCRCAFTSSTNMATNLPNRRNSNGIFNYLIVASLVAVIYLLLEYNCNTCGAKNDLRNITKHIESIANNLKGMKESYRELKSQVERFSLELPKFEGQLGFLEAFANALDTGNLEWDPRNHQPLPNVDVHLIKKQSSKRINIDSLHKSKMYVNESKNEQKLNPH